MSASESSSLHINIPDTDHEGAAQLVQSDREPRFPDTIHSSNLDPGLLHISLAAESCSTSSSQPTSTPSAVTELKRSPELPLFTAPSNTIYSGDELAAPSDLNFEIPTQISHEDFETRFALISKLLAGSNANPVSWELSPQVFGEEHLATLQAYVAAAAAQQSQSRPEDQGVPLNSSQENVENVAADTSATMPSPAQGEPNNAFGPCGLLMDMDTDMGTDEVEIFQNRFLAQFETSEDLWQAGTETAAIAHAANMEQSQPHHSAERAASDSGSAQSSIESSTTDGASNSTETAFIVDANNQTNATPVVEASPSNQTDAISIFDPNSSVSLRSSHSSPPRMPTPLFLPSTTGSPSPDASPQVQIWPVLVGNLSPISIASSLTPSPRLKITPMVIDLTESREPSPLTDLPSSSSTIPAKRKRKHTQRPNRAYVDVPPLPTSISKLEYKRVMQPVIKTYGKTIRRSTATAPAAATVDAASTLVPEFLAVIQHEGPPCGLGDAKDKHPEFELIPLDDEEVREPPDFLMRMSLRHVYAAPQESPSDPLASRALARPYAATLEISADSADASSSHERLPSPPADGFQYPVWDKTPSQVYEHRFILEPGVWSAAPLSFQVESVDEPYRPLEDEVADGFGFGDGTIDPSLLDGPPVAHTSPIRGSEEDGTPRASPTPSPPQSRRQSSLSPTPTASSSRLPAPAAKRRKITIVIPARQPTTPDSPYLSEPASCASHTSDEDYAPQISAKAKGKERADPQPTPTRERPPPRLKPTKVLASASHFSMFDEALPLGKRARKPSKRVLEFQEQGLDEDDTFPVTESALIPRGNVYPSQQPVVKIGPSKSANKVHSTYCHQCRRQRSIPKMCCSRSDCMKIFCETCIRRRYPDIVFDQYIQDFICPRCENRCNCTACCRKRGEEYVPQPRIRADVSLLDQLTDSKPSERPYGATPTPTPPPELSWTWKQGDLWGPVYNIYGHDVGKGFATSEGHVVVDGILPLPPSSNPRTFIGRPQPHWRIRYADGLGDGVAKGKRAYIGMPEASMSQSGYLWVHEIPDDLRELSPDVDADGEEVDAEVWTHGGMNGDDGVEGDTPARKEGAVTDLDDTSMGFVIADVLHLISTGAAHASTSNTSQVVL